MTSTAFKTIISNLCTSHKLLGNGSTSAKCFVYGNIAQLSNAAGMALDGKYLVYMSYPSNGLSYADSQSHLKGQLSAIFYFLGAVADDDTDAIDKVMDDTQAMGFDFIKRLNEIGTKGTYKLVKANWSLDPVDKIMGSNYYGHMVELAIDSYNSYCVATDTWA